MPRSLRSPPCLACSPARLLLLASLAASHAAHSSRSHRSPAGRHACVACRLAVRSPRSPADLASLAAACFGSRSLRSTAPARFARLRPADDYRATTSPAARTPRSPAEQPARFCRLLASAGCLLRSLTARLLLSLRSPGKHASQRVVRASHTTSIFSAAPDGGVRNVSQSLADPRTSDFCTTLADPYLLTPPG